MSAQHPSRFRRDQRARQVRLLMAALVAVASVALLTAPASGVNTFSVNVRVFDPSSTNAQTGAEPSLELDANNVIYAIASLLLGRYIDKVYNRASGAKGGDIHGALVNVVGMHFTILFVVITTAAFALMALSLSTQRC